MPAPLRAETRTISRFRERTAVEQVAQLRLGDGGAVGIGEVDLGERDDAAHESEHLADRQVLARLGHHALVGGDDEQHQIDSRCASHHRSDQPLVTGHVDHREARTAGQVERREAELDGDAARLLLGQAIAVDTGERADQRRLAVIDVTGGAEHESRRSAHRGRR